MVKIGQTLIIDGKEGTIDFDATYKKKYYIGFTVDKKLTIYRVAKKKKEETFVKEENRVVIAYLLATWLAENLDKSKNLKN